MKLKIKTNKMYTALSHPVNYIEGHEFNPNIYRSGGKAKHGKFKFKDMFHGKIKKGNKYTKTNIFELAYTTWGDKGPLVLMQHGVPTNRYQYFPIQKRLSSFVRTVSIDMLGMGQSSMPREYGVGEDSGINQPWDWCFDADRIELFMSEMFPNENSIL